MATLFTGPTATAKSDVPDLPAVDAVIVAFPVFAAVANPLASTLTTLLLELDQAMACPVMIEPPASVTDVVSCCVAPATRLTDPGETTTLLTAPADTATDAVPLVPPAAAVTVELPDLCAVTTPLEEIVATVVLELDHATAWPESTLPLASLSVAEYCCVPPTVSALDDGETVMLFTAPAETAAVALPDAPATVAVIVELPG